MAETVCDTDCTSCCVCIRHSVGTTDAGTDCTRTPPRSRPRRHVRRSLPSTNSIMEVLYPSSYLGTPPAFPDPPSYFSGYTPLAVQGDGRESTGRPSGMPLMTTADRGAVATSSRPDPLIEAPSLTGVPSPGALSGRVPPTELDVPVAGLGIDVLEEVGPPPAYSRFGDGRSRLLVASDILGPYPPIPVLSPPA